MQVPHKRAHLLKCELEEELRRRRLGLDAVDDDPEPSVILDIASGVGEPACSLAEGKYIGKTLTIVDMEGFKLTKFNGQTRAYLKACRCTHGLGACATWCRRGVSMRARSHSAC